MRISITLTTENAAFDPGPEVEVARILRELATKVEDLGLPLTKVKLRDINGNVVGKAYLGTSK